MLLIIGHTSYDENINRFGESRITPSGAAYMGAVGASLITKNIGLVTRVGQDYDLDTLRKLQIPLNGVKSITDGKTTRFKLVYRYQDELKRDFFAEYNVGNDIDPEDIPPQFLKSATCVHIATMLPEHQRRFIYHLRESKPDLPISVDTIEQYILEQPGLVASNLRDVDLVWVDRREYHLLPSSVLAQRAVVLKMGKEGAIYINREQNQIHVNAPFVERVVDKTGSGDVLAGAFLAGITNGDSIEQSLKRACEFASRSIQDFGVEHLLETHRRGKEKV